MNTILEQINSTGKAFVEFAVPMLVQSGVLIVILLLIDLALRKKVKAVFRYCIWMLILLKLILPTSLSSPLSLGYWFGDKLAYVAESRTTAAPEAEVVEPALANMLHIIEPVPIEVERPAPAVLPMMPDVEPAVTEAVGPPAAPVTPVTWQGVVFLLWLAVVIALGLLLLQRAIFVRGLVAQAKEANALMNDALEYCCKCMGVKRKVGLKVSANAASPAVCGLFRPVILLPHKLAPSLGSRGLRAVLLHELAHIRRGDLWVNLAQTVLQIMYFYNPLLWLANAMIRRVREQAIDETVLVRLRRMGEKAQQYPQTLVNVAKLAFKRPVLSLRLIGVVESKSALAGRIKHILNRPMPKSAKLGVVGLLTVIITGAILLPMAKAERSTVEGIKHTLLEVLENPKVNAEGQQILEQMTEVNRYWLVSPSAKVRNYSYDFNLYDWKSSEAEKETIQVKRPTKVNSKWRQGITYDSVLHKLISDPSATIIRKIQRNEQTIQLDFIFKDYKRSTCGNGISHSWRGYFTGLIKVGSLWLDAKKMVPIKVKAGWQVEYFSEYVSTDEGHYVPLKITVGNDDSRYHWMFGFYDPGLWLFENAHYGHDERNQPRMVASINNLKINKRDAVKTKTVVVEVPEFKEGREVKDRKTSQQRKIVTLTLTEQGMSFEGQAVTWDEFPSLLADVPEPENAGLKLVVAVDGLSSKKLNDVKTRISILSRELDLKYLSCISSDVPTSEEFSGEYFFAAPFNFNKEIYIRQNANSKFIQKDYGREEGKWIRITDDTEEHKEWATVYIISIRFRKTWFREQVSAKLKVGYNSWPKAKWQIIVRTLDDEGKNLAQSTSELDTGGYILSGCVLNVSSELDFSLGRWTDISKATTFEISVEPVVEEKPDVQVEGEEAASELKEKFKKQIPLPELVAHKYYKVGEPISISFESKGSQWKPKLEEIYSDGDVNPCVVMINGQQEACRTGFGPFDGIGTRFVLPGSLYGDNDLRFEVGRYTAAYGWKDLDVVSPNDPERVVHYDELFTEEVEFEVVEEIPSDYYKEVYEEGWDEILRQRIETPFTDDWRSGGVAGTLLALKVKPLPFDIAFDIYAQAEGSEEKEPAGQIAIKASSVNGIHNTGIQVKGLTWDNVGDRRWRLILKPSRKAATWFPPIHEYYGREFVTDWLTFERSERFEQHRLAFDRRKNREPEWGGTIKSDKPVDLDRLSKRWKGETRVCWPLPEGFELGWSSEKGGVLRIDPDSGVRMLWFAETNAMLSNASSETVARLGELAQSKTVEINPPKGEKTLIAVRSSEGKVYFVRVHKVKDTWANLSWWEYKESYANVGGEFTATLPNGVTVELVGVCENPSVGKQWWRPDGIPIKKAPIDGDRGLRLTRGDDRLAREFAVRVLGSNAAPFPQRIEYEILPCYDHGLNRPLFKNGRPLSDMWVIGGSIPTPVSTCIVRIFVSGWCAQFENVSLQPGIRTEVDVLVPGTKGEPVPADLAFRQAKAKDLSHGIGEGRTQMGAVHAWEELVKRGDISNEQRLFATWRMGCLLSVNLDSERGEHPDFQRSEKLLKKAMYLVPGLLSNETINSATLYATHPGSDLKRAERLAESYRFLKTATQKMYSKSAERINKSGYTPDKKFFYGIWRLPIPSIEERMKGLEYRVDDACIVLKERITGFFKYKKDEIAYNHLFSLLEGVADVEDLERWRNIVTTEHPDVQVEGEKESSDQDTKEVFLPDEDISPVALRLTSGKLLRVPDVNSANLASAINELGVDLVYASNETGDSKGLVFLRGATADKQLYYLKSQNLNVYEIGRDLPEVLVVTTSEGARYVVEILSADKYGCRLKYHRLDKPNVQVEANKEKGDLAGGAATQPVEKTVSEKQVEIRANTEKRHRLDEYPYQEEYRNGATHVLGTIHGNIVWTVEKSPYAMDENVWVAKDGSLTIEPGVVVKVVRLTESTSSINAYVSLIIHGTLLAEGRPNEVIKFTSASEEPTKYREWQGLVFGRSCSPSILKWTLVEDAIFGVDAYGSPLIAHCIFRKCHTGIYLERDFVGDVVHNISAYNLYSGIRCKGTRAEATIINNICYENGDGIDAWAGAVARADYNLYWSTRGRRYYSGIKPGDHDICVAPGFADVNADDFRLLETSPARSAGFENTDMGLFVRGWSEKAARYENWDWLVDGARSLWYVGLEMSRNQGRLQQAQQNFESALGKRMPSELRDKISCSLGHVLTSQKLYRLAKQTLEKVLSDSKFPHLRDLARCYLAEVLAEEGQHQEALSILEDLEWPQSEVWAKSTKAEYTVAAGDLEEALLILESLKDSEPNPDRYLKAVAEMISDCVAANQIDAAITLMKGFEDYPLAKEVAGAYLNIAKAARSQKHSALAVELLRKSCERDPFSKETPESLFLLAEILESDLERLEEANAVRSELCTNYFPYNFYVMETKKKLSNKENIYATKVKDKLSEQSEVHDKKILLDGSLGESSIFDRWAKGGCNFGQYEVIRILTDAGYIVHVNNRERLRGSMQGRQLIPEVVNRYDLIVCNGRYGGEADPPIDQDIIENLVAYVQEGGNLLVVGGGRELGSGKFAQFYNPLIEQFGIRFVKNTSLTKSRGVVTNHPATKELDGFWAEAGVPVSVDEGEVLGHVDGEPVIAVVQYRKGKVIAAGLGSGFMGAGLRSDTSGKSEARQNNRKLLLNLVSYLFASADAKQTQEFDVQVVFPPDSTIIDLNYVTAQPDDDSTVQDIEHLLILRECTYEVDTQDLFSEQIAEKSVWWAVFPSVDRGNQKVFPVELIVETEQSVTPHSNYPADVEDLPGKKRLHWTANEKRVPSHFGFFGSTIQETVTGVEIRRECIPLGKGRARIKIIVRAQTSLLIRIWGLKRRVNIEPESIQPQTYRLSDNGVLFFDYGKNSEGLGSESEYSFVISGLNEGELFYPMTNALHRIHMRQGCSFSPLNQVRGSIWEFDFTLKSEQCFRIAKVEKWVNNLYQLKSLSFKQ